MVSSGRPGLYVWVAYDLTNTTGDDDNTDDDDDDGADDANVVSQWTGFNVAEAHNRLYPNASLHFPSVVPSRQDTTSYTGTYT